ncbi:ead/Ea22-like family protein [Enterobacter roggenkampii]|uniref:ead/Ea22-like family protein n=1 Tax=Enterobacter roggenkampii TaxID=1812935 RepID=UPI001C5B3D6A|nr:ead/Ea22-like family protein [Enterobacter roggenkampii]MBW4236975.1 ead/Ea22-like family protein [Enterobacter roggenkampii]
MINIDKRALREAAEKALPAMKRLLMMPNDELFDEALLNVDGDVDAANAFNLLTGPETVLALLDELEAAEKRIAELEAKLDSADKLQDSAFRHGLQHGFSLGQTDNQAGFEECLSAYGTGKGE